MHVTRKAFDELVEEAIASLPPRYAVWIEEVPIIVEDHPGAEDLKGVEGADQGEGGPLGLYVGGTLEEDGVSGALPARVMLYRVPLMEACDTREQLGEEIRKTLLHELGHHAGLDEDDLDELGYGPPEEDEEIDWEVEDP
jgi:predicted Zn-dependent protease with MMP-like domain